MVLNHNEVDNEHQHFLQQLVRLFIIPQVEERKLDTPLDLKAFQIIFLPDRKPEVHINSEVRANVKAKLKQGILKTLGDTLAKDDVEEWIIDLKGHYDDECCHVTCFRVDTNTWISSFNVLCNKEEAEKHVKVANQFYMAAQFCLQEQHINAFAYNIFLAAELTAKSILLSTPGVDRRAIDSHGSIKKKFNKLCKDIEFKEFLEKYNILEKIRNSSRYLTSDTGMSNSEAHAILNDVENFIKSADLRLKQ